MTATEWRIDDQDIEYQARYWKRRAEQAEAQLEAERKRKEPATLTETEKALKQAHETIAHERDEARVWKEVSGKMSDRVTALESDGPAAVLRRERDHWRASWRNATRRLGNAIEHLGLDHTGAEPRADAE